MAFSESLTVRILGDSSQLKAELQSVLREIGALQGAVDRVTHVGDRVREGFGRGASAIRPLEQMSQVMGRLIAQAAQLGQMPITLNVQPALQALSQLSQAIQAVAGQLAALAVMPTGAGVGGVGVGPIRTFAEGGLVRGPAGRDRVPALLSAGEYVLSQQATLALGTEFLDQLNATTPSRPARTTVRESPARVQNTTNHFGGITIHVANAARVNDLIRDLRLHGVHLRNRRG